MKKFLIILVVNLVLTLTQTAFFFEFLGPDVNPNLVLAFTLSLFFLGQTEFALISGFIGGLLIDLVGFSIIGSSSVVFIFLLMIIFYIRKYIFKGWLLNALSVVLFSRVYLAVINFGKPFDYKSVVLISCSTFMASLVFYFINRKLFYEANLL